MTSQQRAYEVARKWLPDSAPDSMRVIALMCHIQLAIDAAVAEEREECAKVAQDCTDRAHPGIAAQAIRARGTR